MSTAADEKECPFCAEAMPHVKELYDKYSKDGLVIIGVHVPRIDYEKEIPKIKDAVAKKEIKYPVVVDNMYSGTGRYEDTEKVIQKLLAKNNGK